jgi:Domain of unknown function (DUF4126)
MEPLQQLGLAMGAAWTSGINLYATVAALGIAQAAGLVQLPPGLEVLANPAVIAVAVVMYFVEFFADKVPYVDSGWDAVHTFIRVPAGALLAARALGPTNPALEVVAALAGGSVALAAHGTKASVRLAINASPEPFTNWSASVAEDIVAFAGIWAAFQHPYVMLALVIAFLALAIYSVPKILRGLRTLFRKLTGRDTTGTDYQLPAAGKDSAMPFR